MNLKAVEQLPDSVVHLTYLTKRSWTETGRVCLPGSENNE